MAAVHSTEDLQTLCAQAARHFAVLSSPLRLHIISSLCHGEKNVGELLADVPTRHPNLSQHLATLYRAGFVRKRRQGSQIIYEIADERVVRVCQLMCSHSG